MMRRKRQQAPCRVHIVSFDGSVTPSPSSTIDGFNDNDNYNDNAYHDEYDDEFININDMVPPESSTMMRSQRDIESITSTPENGDNNDDENDRNDDGTMGSIPDGAHKSQHSSGSSQSSGSTRTSSGNTQMSSSMRELYKDLFAWRLRKCVFVVLILSPVLMFTALIVPKRKEQRSEFEEKFNTLSSQVIDACERNLDNILMGLDSVSVAATSHAMNYNQTWPCVTLSDFDLLGETTKCLMRTPAISIYHVVQRGQRTDWENYTISNIDSSWMGGTSIETLDNSSSSTSSVATPVSRRRVLASANYGDDSREMAGTRRRKRRRRIRQRQRRELQGQSTEEVDLSHGYAQQIVAEVGPPDNFFDNENYTIEEGESSLPFTFVVDPSDGPYLPCWQSFPVDPLCINYNLLSDVNEYPTLQRFFSESYGMALLSPFVHNISSDSTASDDDSEPNAASRYRIYQYSKWLQDQTGDPDISYNGEPVSTIYFPVFDTFANGEYNATNDGGSSTREIVAIVSTPIFWNQFFENLFPSHTTNNQAGPYDADDDGIENSGVLCVIENPCGGVFTYRVDELSGSSTFLGYGSYFDDQFDDEFELVHTFASLRERNNTVPDLITTTWLDDEYCPYTIRIYPSIGLQSEFLISNTIVVFPGFMVTLLLTTCGFAALYDFILRRRIQRILDTKKRANHLVASHFPDLVQDRLLRTKKERKKMTTALGYHRQRYMGTSMFNPKSRIRTYLVNSPHQPHSMRHFYPDDALWPISSSSSSSSSRGAPIADLFLHCTILFANINGFSAWSSEREPSQVFTLLETLYQTFDKVAKKRNVFKVETIADTYIAVTGLPEPQTDHASRMCRFARECLSKAHKVTRFLETILGPGTANLRFRFGLHSGQVTAGVLEGEKTRFQLFGDTVNTAARMESTGEGNRIQVSEATAELLFDTGKEDWIQARQEPVNVKGKGLVQTYWLVHRISRDAMSRCSSVLSSKTSKTSDLLADDEDAKATGFSDEKDLWDEKEGKSFSLVQKSSKVSRNQRIVQWLTELLKTRLQRIVAQRMTKAVMNVRRQRLRPGPGGGFTTITSTTTPGGDGGHGGHRRELLSEINHATLTTNKKPLDEVVDAFVMPKFNPKQWMEPIDPETIELDTKVEEQLREYVESISMLYRDNRFHNFEHASHVTMSAIKLLNRIGSLEQFDFHGTRTTNSMTDDVLLSELQDFTYGITADAMVQFAVAFSTLIHDTDNRGIPNEELVVENPDLGEKYNYTSVSQQNSTDRAWDLLMEPKFKDLQDCIFCSDSEAKRFRQYVCNLVLCTDDCDEEFKQRREERWIKAFRHDTGTKENISDFRSSHSGLADTPLEDDEAPNVKATIVLEHIIQAADVSHTMQHWKVYIQWNERLFEEMYAAYESGRAAKDPSIGWYEDEIAFFDNHVIPLAKKLETCGILGVAGEEGLIYALQNRKEWERKGQKIVNDMVDRYNKRKNLEVGGFTPDEINNFSSTELENLLKLLIKKGRAFGTYKGDDKHGQRMATQAWLDALEIHERCPATSSLRDQTLLFPVFSGITVFLKGGKILQDADCQFEKNMAEKYVRDTKRMGDPVHYSRALAMLCEVQAGKGLYRDALATLEKIKIIYDPTKHHDGICQSYGTDRTAHAFSQSALWYHALGDAEKSIEACEYVLKELLHLVDPANILNSCELLLPIMRIKVYKGEVKPMRDLFSEHVVENYQKYDIKFTPCRPIFKPLVKVLDLWHDSDGYPNFDDDVEWLLHEPDAGEVNDFLSNIYVKLGWCPNTMTADLCLAVATKLFRENPSTENGNSDERTTKRKTPLQEKLQVLVKKGIKACTKGNLKMRDQMGNVIMPIANEIHEPVVAKFKEFAKDVDILWDEDETSSSCCITTAADRTTLKTSLGTVRIAA